MIPRLIPLAGFLAAKAVQHILKDASASSIRFSGTKTTQFELGRAGHGLTIRTTLEGSGVADLVGSMMIVRPKKGSSYIRSKHPDYSDSDGDITTVGPVTRPEANVTGMAHIPFVAFPDPDTTVDLEIAVIKDGDCAVGPSLFGDIVLEATKFDRRHALAAMCDAAFAAIRMEQALDRGHVRAAKETITDAWRLDDLGVEVLRRNLKRAASTPLEASWFDPARLATDIGDELSGDDRVAAVRMLYSIAASKGPLGSKGDGFLGRIGRLLSIAEDDMAGIREQYAISSNLSVLGLNAGATLEDIKRAYRRAVRYCHPDLVGHLDARQREAKTEEFRRLTAAYEALTSQAS